MKVQWRYIRFRIVNSFWFVPSMLVVAAIALAAASAALDRMVDEDWEADLSWVLWVDPSGARDVVAVIAGSMITATSLVFSMTLVALTLATRQLGPRLMSIFKSDRLTQFVLGAFIATLVYSLILLRLISTESDGHENFVPFLSVTIAQLLALLSLGVLIYFIHHLAEMLQADTIISQVGDTLDQSIETTFPAASGRQGEPTGFEKPASFERLSAIVPTPRSGYVQTLDTDCLLRLAAEADAVIEVMARPGHFLLQGEAIARLWPQDRATVDLTQKIANSAVIGAKRTPAEDLEYSANALVEIALRALSPGVNDPFTAVACVNRLGAALATALRRDAPAGHRVDSGGRVRLILPRIDFIELLDVGLGEIRRSAAHSVTVTATLISVLGKLALSAPRPQHRAAIEQHMASLDRAVAKHFADPDDRNRLETALSLAAASLRRWG